MMMHGAVMLKRWRADKALTQAALAEKLGCDNSTISQLEIGARLPSLQLAVVISEVTFGYVTVDSWTRESR